MEDLARSRISSTSPYSNEPISCICRLGPKSIEDFDPKFILKRWLEAPFLEKNGRGRYSKGKLSGIMQEQ
jgi:hypothetical protein